MLVLVLKLNSAVVIVLIAALLLAITMHVALLLAQPILALHAMIAALMLLSANGVYGSRLVPHITNCFVPHQEYGKPN